MRFLDTPGSESPRIPQQNAPLDAIGRCRNGGNRPFNQGVAGSIPARPTNRIDNLRRVAVAADSPVSALCQQRAAPFIVVAHPVRRAHAG